LLVLLVVASKNYMFFSIVNSMSSLLFRTMWNFGTLQYFR
jgi:hypothetical protein